MNLGSDVMSRRSVVPASPLQASGAFSRFASPSYSRGGHESAGGFASGARSGASASGRAPPGSSSAIAADDDMNLSAALGFDAAGGDDSAIFDDPRGHSASSAPVFVRDEAERVASLERTNFDLKMKVFYMEEQMRKLSESANQADAAEDLREQNQQLRGDLEERTLEVEQRNALLVKAKQAIEALKAEVTKLRSEDSSDSAARLAEAENRVRAALRAAEDAEAKCKADNERFQLKISSLEQALALKDQLLSSVDDKARASSSSLSSLSAELDAAHATISKLEDQCRSYQKKLQEVNQQLIDCRSDCDIAQIELAEQIDACNALSQRAEDLRAIGVRAREELARTQAEAARASEEMRQRLESTIAEYEAQLQAARASAEQDVSKMAAAHSVFIQELRETHERELQRKDELMRSTRGLDGSELLRLKDDLQNRLREKTDELRILQNSVEIERTRSESFRREAEHAKHEARERLQSIDQLKAELVTMEVLREQLRGAKEALQRETAERIHAVSKIEALSDALESSRNATRELEAECNALNNEIGTLRSDLTSSRKSGESLQELTRENERLKASSSSLREEVKELSEAGLVHQTEVKGLKEMLNKYSAELERTRSALKASDAHGEYVEGLLTEEKVRAAAFEASVAELRVLCDRMNAEIETERSTRAEMEKHHQETHKRIDTMSKDSEDLLVLLLGALLEWDNALEAMGADATSSLTSPSGRKHSSASDAFRDASMYIREARLVLKDRTMDSGDLTKMSIVRIEKVRSKMERLLRLKSNFETQFNQVTSNVTFKFDSLLDKVKLLGHRVTAAETRCGSVGTAIEKEYKKRSVENEENRSFREMVLSQHSQQVQSLTEAMERERSAAANLRAELDAKRKEVEELSQQVSVIETAESSVRDLTAKFNEVVESNRLLMLELNDRNAKYDKMRKEFSTISAEHTVVVQKLSEKELEAARLSKDVEYLRAREIDPELERTFRETQSIMKSYRSGGTGSPVSRGGDALSLGGGTGPSRELGTVIDRVAMLTRSAEALVQSTSGVIDQYARWISGQRNGKNVDQRRLAEEVVEMLDRNHRLSMQLRDLTTELRRVAWSINEDRETSDVDRHQMAAMRFGSDRDDRFDEDAYRPGTSGSMVRTQPPSPPSSQHGGFMMSPVAAPQSQSQSGGYGAPRESSRSDFSSDRRRVVDSMPPLASPQFASSLRSSNSSYAVTEPLSNTSYSNGTNYAAPGRNALNDSVPMSGRNSSAQSERHDFRSYSDEFDPSRTQPLPPSIAAQHTRGISSSSLGSHPPALSIPSSSSSLPASLTAMSAASPIPVPFTSPRTSSNRLARLSEDLQTLAKKLDGFDASRPRF